MNVTDTDLALWWLAHLFETGTAEGWLTLFSVDHDTGARSVAWAEVDDLVSLRGSIEELGSRGDLWFGVAPRRQRLPNGQRGGVSECVSVPAFWLDVDVAGVGHKLPNLPADIAEAAQLVKRCPLQPSAVVKSGYGVQAWWLLAEPLPAVEAGDLLVRWQATWGTLAKEAGLHLDNVSNLDRVMRLPGTFNWKGSEPVPVTVRAEFDRCYQASDFDDWCDPPPPPSERQRAFTAHLAGSRFNEAHTPEEELTFHRWELVRADPNGDQHWHHPGSANDISATVYAEDWHTTIWSETVAAQTGCPTRQPMDCYGLFTWLRFKGDFAASHGWLLEHGYRDLGGRDLTSALAGTPDPAVLPPAAPRSGSGGLIVVRASTVTPSPVDWLWEGWLPGGMLVALDGDPDTGKSTMILDLAARLTQGGLMPDGSNGTKPSGVVLLSGEDDLDKTIVYRLMAAGADLEHIHCVQAVVGEHGEAPFTIPGDLAMLEVLIRETGSALVIVDVLNEYLDSRVDSHKDHDIRRTLHLMRVVAANTGASFVLLRHLRKEGSSKAMYRGGGSIGIIGAARAGWLVAYHPENEGMRVLAPVKMNIAVRPTPQGFLLLPHDHLPCAYLHWQGPVNLSADQLLNPPPKVTESPEETSQVDLCAGMLEMILADGREGWTKDVLDELAPFRFNQKTIEKARARANVQVRKIGKPDNDGKMGWKMYIPRKDTP